MKIPIILDTDPGTDIDDLFALALALRHPALDLVGVTTVYGDVQARARLVSKILRMAGASRIPVCAGIRVPEPELQRKTLAADFTDFLNHTQYVTARDPEFALSYPDAIEFILKMLFEAREPLGLVGIGPWSNLAAVLKSASKKQLKNIRFIALMGGEPWRMRAEHNVVCDPEAADIVLTSDVPKFMASFELTRKVNLSEADVESYLGGTTDPLLEALYETTQMWLPHHRHIVPGPVLYDVVPVFWAADPSLVKTTEMQLRVETQGFFSRGFTIPVRGQTHRATQVSSQLDPEALKKLYFEIIQ
jgi:purine nucleosidase